VILIDTSVWVGFFKGSHEAKFAGQMVRENTALLHPLVFSELLLRGLSAENETLLQALPTIQPPSTEKIYKFIKQNPLPGKGICWMDAAILYSAHEDGTALATFDETLRACAGDLGITCLPSG
jgi:predicted nucleic acid-binding protein